MTSTTTLNSAQLLIDQTQQFLLLAAVNAMVPPAPELELPGAGDADIFADIVASIGSRHTQINAVLTALQQGAQQQWQQAFDRLDSAQQLLLVTQLQESMPEQVWQLISVTFECYYRDDRVMQSLNMDNRPAFPQGYEVEQGDWSLLDPVKKRAPFYRQV